MLTRIRHLAHGHLKLGGPLKFTIDDRKFILEVDEKGFLSAVSVTAKVSANSVPQVDENPKGPAKLDINVPSDPVTHLIRNDLRTAQGALAFFGLREIELNKPEQEWIPESEEEKKLLKVSKLSLGYGDLKDVNSEDVSPDIVVRCFAAADLLLPSQTVLGFFRKGCVDVDEAKYIDAYYDFFFVFEHVFGNGQWRTRDMKKNFAKSDELVAAVQGVQSTFAKTFGFNSPHEQARCIEMFIKPPASEVLGSLVDLRGFLHHHSAKRKKNWDPEGHDTYRVPAIFSQRVAFTICWDAVSNELFGDNANKRLEEIANCVQGEA